MKKITVKIHLSSKAQIVLAISSVILLLLLGIGIMVYPMVSSMYMETVRSGIQTQYQQQLADSNEDQLSEIREAAKAYNIRLASGELSLLEPTENGYFDQMLVPGMTDVMAYIHIPKIHVDLPVYHGVGNDALSSGCGHMPQSSLPVGGESTHAVISAHTGMASSSMFSDLPLLVPGDIFQLDVLGETLTYEIQSEADIQTVLPVEVRAIQIKNGEDLCTLVTCVPFGINTHRLLVTGHRIPTLEKAEDQEETLTAPPEANTSVWQDEYWKSIQIGVFLILVILLIAGTVGAFFYLRKEKGKYLK